MSLAEQQSLLARLYTNSKLRAKFLAAPFEVGLANGLSEIESRQFARIVPHELQCFAESLFYKRLRQVEKLLPLTGKILDQQFSELFRCFADQFLPADIKKHFADAVAFAAFLQTENQVSPWLADLVGFEAAKLEINGDNRFFAFRIFQHDIREIIRIVVAFRNRREASDELLKLQRRRTLAVWLRTGRRSSAASYFVW